jgi:hypothetical protein
MTADMSEDQEGALELDGSLTEETSNVVSSQHTIRRLTDLLDNTNLDSWDNAMFEYKGKRVNGNTRNIKLHVF